MKLYMRGLAPDIEVAELEAAIDAEFTQFGAWFRRMLIIQGVAIVGGIVALVELLP